MVLHTLENAPERTLLVGVDEEGGSVRPSIPYNDVM